MAAMRLVASAGAVHVVWRERDMRRRILAGVVLAIPVIVFLAGMGATAVEY